MEKSKILFIGADSSTKDALNYVKSLGIYSIVTDNRPTEEVQEKQIADEAWNIDIMNIDELVKCCLKEGVTAAFAGNQEKCLDQCKKLCERMGFPFYASDDGWKATRNKAYYKEICEECGLHTPPWIRLNPNVAADEINKLHFPIVVKPTDSCAQQGLSIVHNPADVIMAYNKALEFSENKEIIAEEFIPGDDLFVYVYIHEGVPYVLGVAENMPVRYNGRINFGFAAHFGYVNSSIKSRIRSQYEKVLYRLKCREGLCIFQSKYLDGTFYNYELGYRLDGVRGWRHNKKVFGISELELMVDNALGRTREGIISAYSQDIDDYNASVNYYLWIKPGHIKKIIGKKTLYERDDCVFLQDNYKEGDDVPKRDNMRSIAYNIVIYGNDHRELDKKIKDINEILHIYDEQDHDMLIYLDNYYDTWLVHREKWI